MKEHQHGNAKEGCATMQIIHVMKDGTTRNSVAGVVIKSEQFYQVLQGIIEKQKKVTT